MKTPTIEEFKKQLPINYQDYTRTDVVESLYYKWRFKDFSKYTIVHYSNCGNGYFRLVRKDKRKHK